MEDRLPQPEGTPTPTPQETSEDFNPVEFIQNARKNYERKRAEIERQKTELAKQDEDLRQEEELLNHPKLSRVLEAGRKWTRNAVSAGELASIDTRSSTPSGENASLGYTTKQANSPESTTANQFSADALKNLGQDLLNQPGPAQQTEPPITPQDPHPTS